MAAAVWRESAKPAASLDAQSRTRCWYGPREWVCSRSLVPGWIGQKLQLVLYVANSTDAGLRYQELGDLCSFVTSSERPGEKLEGNSWAIVVVYRVSRCQ